MKNNLNFKKWSNVKNIISRFQQDAMGNACLTRQGSSEAFTERNSDERESSSLASKTRLPSNLQAPNSSQYIRFLSSSWPGSILKWSEEDLKKFANCFRPHYVKIGDEVRLNYYKAHIHYFLFHFYIIFYHMTKRYPQKMQSHSSSLYQEALKYMQSSQQSARKRIT